MVKPLAIIDLIAILPFYLPLFWPNIIFTRSFRLFRIFRLFKISRYSSTVKLFGKVIKSKQEEIVIALFIALVLLVTSASLIYFAEHEAQPNDFPHIPAAMWWGIVTLTTVGYGDVYPITPLGKFLGAIAALVDVLVRVPQASWRRRGVAPLFEHSTYIQVLNYLGGCDF